VIRWEPPGPYEVVFTTREGGVSDGAFASLNLGKATEDDPANVEENRRRACAAIGASPDRLALNRQHHSATVHRARPGARDEWGDALWTDEEDLPVMALGADCLPIALVRVNGGGPAVAVLHAGWRGLLAGVAQAAVAELGGDVAAMVGPGIGPCCYEVGEEVAGRFPRELVCDRRLDLWAAAERALREGGCDRVERADLCTACNPDLFFSHRRDAGRTGRQGVLARVA
jgi:purine-nucleoside/S-methyl-5'-thioadenosine phosphorylase / adenosine deaminase